MIKRYTPILLWALLVTIALSSIVTLTSRGPELVMKTYTQSGQFQNYLDAIYKDLGRTVLNPIDLEAAEKKLTVSPEEIESYRTYYGSLADQVDSIQMQYEDRIQEAESKSAVKEALVKERDGKIADIQKNFEDEAYVEKKILNEKKRQLSRLIHEYKNSAEASGIPVAYDLQPTEGGESHKKWEFDGSFGYERTFSAEEGYLKIEGIDESSYGYGDFTVTTDTSDSAAQQGEGVSLSTEDLNAIVQPAILYKGTVAIPSSVFQEGGILYDEVKEYRSVRMVLIVSMLAGIAALVALFTVWKFKWHWFVDLPFEKRYDALRVDSKAGIFVILLLYVWNFAERLSYRLHIMEGNGYSFDVPGALISVALCAAAITFLAFQVVNALSRYRKPGVWESDWRDSYMMRLIESVQDLFLNRSIGVQTFILLIGFFLAGVGFVGASINGSLFIVYAFCVLFFGLPVLFIYMRRMGYLSRIMTATEEMAGGRLNSDIKVIGRSQLAKHAMNLNNLREGVEHSMSSQAKSERLKTELITNVSHDLRTPLTSIITYTDLLKTPNLSDGERAEYLDVLDRKSQRLKTLIEDLFEVSKMSSGTMELYKQRVDLTQLVQQAIGEHAERMAEIPLDFRVSLPEEPLPAVLDGQRWWRMLDNLIGNALKYSLPGTRVFVTLRETGGMAELIIKNITAYELNENVDELYERFKRGDASRHTDGSGLGLAIAQSIVDMHGGTMAIDVDGDLFKVTVRVPLA